MSRAAQDESFVSSRSVASRSQSTSTKPKSGKVEPYVSPYVAKATKRAEERVKQALRAQQRSKPKVAYEWDESINTPGLFDPKIRKQEVFRLKPKRTGNKQGSRDDGDDSRDIMDTSLFDSSFSSSTNKNRRPSTNRRVTMRTDDVSPRRAPSSARIVPQSVFQGGTYPAVRSSNDSNNSGSTVNKHPVATTTNRASHRPPVHNNHQVVHRGKGVTRSTSPIDESVVDDILAAEPQHEHDKHYKLRHRNPADQGDNHQHQQQHHSLSGTGGKMDRAAAKELYGNMIRERLRAILMQHRGGNDNDGNDFGGVSMGNGSSSRRGFYGPSRVQQEQELAARDLMASMATIMTAVGEIVTMKSHKKKWYKQSLRRSRSASAVRDGISPEREYYPSNSNTDNNSRVAPNATQYSTNGGGYMSAVSERTPAPSAAGGGVSFALTRPDLSPNPFYRPVVNEEGKKSTANFMFDLARTIEPMPYARDPQLPENKAAAFDMIMSKLQSIEQCEREMQVFLQHPQRPVDDEDDQPVDPILRDLQQSMARKVEEERRLLSKPPRSVSTTVGATEGEATSTVVGSVPQNAAGIKADPTSEGYAFLKQYPSLAQISSELRPSLEEYKKQLNKARQLREVAFTSRKNSTSAVTGDTVADAIFDKLTAAVAKEIDRFTEDYSKSFAKQL